LTNVIQLNPIEASSCQSGAIHSWHPRGFFVFGGMTLICMIVFRELKRGDGDAVSQAKELHAE